MSTLAPGSSTSLNVAAGGQVAVSNSGGLFVSTETVTGSAARTTVHGPVAHDRVFGPYSLSATLSLQNQSVSNLVYIDSEPVTPTTSAITAGSNQTYTLTDQGKLAIASSGGFWTATVTPAIGSPSTIIDGPSSGRRVLGPYPGGATIAVTNQTCPSLVCVSSTAGASYLFRKTNVASRVYARGGAGLAANAVQWVNGQSATSGFVTSHVCMDLEAPFTGIRLIFGNVDAVSYPITDASVAAGATLNDLTNSTDGARQNFVRVTFGGGSTGATIPAAVGGNAGMLKSDLISVASLTRQAGDATTWSVAGGKLADSYTRPLLHVRVAQPITSASTPLLGQSTYGGNASTTDAPYTPVQPTKTGRMVAVTHKVDVTAQTSVGAATALTGTSSGTLSGILCMPIIGIEYVCGVNVMTVCTTGDSISFGAGVIHDGPADANSPAAGSSRSWSRVATETVSTMTQPIEFCSLAVSGQTTTTFEAYFENLINGGVIPTHAVYASFSPNDGAGGPGATQVTNLNAFLTKCAASNVYPITWTGLPVGLLAPQKLSNAGELARLAWNASMRAGTLVNNAYGQPIDYMEMDQCGDGSGQTMSDNVTPIASMTNSPVHWGDLSTTLNLHPNYTGDKAMRGVFASKVTSIAAQYFP